MPRGAGLVMVALLLALGSLAACAPAPDRPAVVVATPAPFATTTPIFTLPPVLTPTAVPPATPTQTRVLTETTTPAAAPSSTPSPTEKPAAESTFTPTALPLQTAAAGQTIPLSLGWRFGSTGHLTAGIVILRGGQPVLVMASLGRTVTALSESGEILWQASTNGPAYALARMDSEQIAVGDDAGQVTMLDYDGDRLWRYGLGSRVTALQAGWDGDLLAGGWDQRLTLLAADAEVERLHWQVDVGGPISSIIMAPSHYGSSQEHALADTSPSEKGVAIVATLDGDLVAFDSQGLQKWRFDAGGPVTHLGTIEGSGEPLVLAGVQDGRLQALTVAEDNVQVQWERNLGQGAPVWAAAQVTGNADPEIIVGMGAETPRLVLLSLTGALLWQVSTPAPVAALATVDLDGNGDNEILAGLASGEIQVFDSQGRVRGSVHAGLSVWELEPARDGAAFALADVVAWRLNPFAGPAGGNWLPPPDMVPLPYVVSPVDGGESGVGDDQDGQATLVFLGDVMPGRSVERQLARYGPDYPWDGLRPLLIDADLAMGNLEGVLTTQGQPLDKSYLIRAHPRWHETLTAARLGLVTLANNHALDFGDVGLDETLSVLADSGIGTVGAGTATDTTQAQHPSFYDLDGVRVAILAYAASRWNGSPDMPATQRVGWAEPETVRAGVRAAREGADMVVVILHAGTEYADEPSSDQLAVAHAAVDAGADLVVGHHPHVTQAVERYGRGLIVYSLGDALFDIPRPAAMLGHLLRVHVTRQGLVQAELWPFWIDEAIRPRLLDDGQGLPRVEIIYP